MLPGLSLPVLRTGDVNEQQRVNDAMTASFSRVLLNADLDKVQVGGVALTGGTPLAVPHKLGRQPVGWRVVDVTGGALAIQRTAWDRNTITLQNANTCVIAIEAW